MVLVTDKEFYMDGYLKANLDIAIRNIHKDLDFVIPISGGGDVRIGKSVLAQQIGYYINYEVNKRYKINNKFDIENNYCFDGSDLINKGLSLKDKPYSVLIYDEAGYDLQSSKTLHRLTQKLLDFFRECGQLNLFIILVLPDFFDLPIGIATNRSIFLLDVYFEGEFDRGQFKFFDKKLKKKLYIYYRRERNYLAVHPNFRGKFTNFYCLNEDDYRNTKKKALIEKDKKKEEDNENFWSQQRNIAWFILNKELEWNYDMIVNNYFKYGYVISYDQVRMAIKRIEKELNKSSI